MDETLILHNRRNQARQAKGLSQATLVLCIALDCKFEELFYF